MNPQDIFNITSHPDSKQPLIFKNLLKWNIINWSLEDWSKAFNNEELTFRKIPFWQLETPLWENRCEKCSFTLSEFIKNKNQEGLGYYFEYEYMKDHFRNRQDVIKEVAWSDLGYNNLTGNDSTIWIGSRGSHTICHKDTYGYNLVAQIHGHKLWVLFPPETDMQSTRVPFEESTIFSKINLFCPNVEQFKDIEGARYIVLEPGDVLYVPNGWWHYVQNLDTAISINTWIPIPELDTKRRIEEGLISLYISSFLKNETDKYNLLNDLYNKPDDYEDQHNQKILPILHHQVLELNKLKSTKAEGNKIDFKNLLQSNSNYVKVVEPSLKQDFNNFLNEQRKRYEFKPKEPLKGLKYFTLENTINSYCKPENISEVADSFIKNWSLTEEDFSSPF